MLRTDFKKILSTNRSTAITMLVCLGIMLLGFFAVLITVFLLPDKQDAAMLFIVVPIGGMILNIWVVLFCSLMLYTGGYTIAVGMGMTRRAYLRGASLLSLAYTAASALISLLGAGTAFMYSLWQAEELAEKMRQQAADIVWLALALVVVYLLFSVFGKIFAFVLLRYGAKLMAAPILAISALCMMLPQGIDLYEAIPQDSRFSANLMLGLAAMILVAVLSVVGRQLIYRHNI